MRHILAVTKALADEGRLRILASLRGGELCVCQIVELLELAPSTVSQHLALLQQAELVTSRKDGRWVHYRLSGREASVAVRRALSFLQAVAAEEKVFAEDRRRLKDILRRDPADLACAQRSSGTRRKRALAR